ncbi:MAG TPA: T9SS type A sorting domain-containing protein, partial [Candidatus Kapabacteria bacterium]
SLVVEGVNLVAGTTRGIFFSTNNGIIWTQQNSGLTDTLIRSLLINGSTLFAGTYSGGIFLSTNDGASWKEINAGLTETDVRSLKVSGEYLFAATQRGVWRRPLSELIPSAVSPSEQPTAFTLEANHPNPFTDYTTLNFTLLERGYVILDIYDLLGQKIRTLISEILDAGKHSREFNTKDLATGAYIAKLRVNGAEQEMKIVKVAN